MQESQRKRQRTSIACVSCRKKRVKCDGRSPSCSACQNASRVCQYEYDKDTRKPPSKSLVQALQLRIAYLEDQLGKDQPAPENLPNDSFSTIPGLQGAEVDDLADPVTDLTNLLGRLNVMQDGVTSYFGPRSNLSMSGHQFASFQCSESTPLPSRMASGLSEHLQDHLLDLFWTWQNPWNYLVHKKRFLSELATESGRYCTSLLLFSVLALAARYSDNTQLRTDPEDHNTAGNELAERAKRLLHQEIESPSVSTVGAAMILAMREMAVDKEPVGWTYAGMACRLAFNLGLHLDCSPLVSTGQMSETEEETRNITFWGCYVLDRLFVVGLGRPGTIRERDITAKLPPVDPDVDTAPWIPIPKIDVPRPQCSYQITSVHNLCKIFRISSEALDNIYSPDESYSRSRRENDATDVYAKLETFYNQIPGILRLTASINTPRPPHIYLFHLQYHTAVIQVHRPFLTKPRRQDLWDMVGPEKGTHGLACSTSARAITNIIRAYRTHYGLRRIAISAVHCVGTSSIVHLFDLNSSDPLIQKESLRLFRYNSTCLKEMSVPFSWSQRATRATNRLATRWGIELELETDEKPETSRARQCSNSVHDTERGNIPATDIQTPCISNRLLDFQTMPDIDFMGFPSLFDQDTLDWWPE